MPALPQTRSCFVCGIDNPAGFRLAMESDGRCVEVAFRFQRTFTGFRDTVHGGATATVLDELMAWAIGVTSRHFSYCAEMTVRYLRPIAPEVEVCGWAEVTENKRNRLFLARAELRDAAGQVLAEATGKYLPIPGDAHREMLDEFVTDPSAWIGPLRPASAGGVNATTP